jgi:polyisoprenoid-binding protein YceI
MVCTIFAISQTQLKVSKSAISFKINNAGITVDGTISGFIADIKFDALNYSTSTINVSLDVNTLNTGIDLRNKHLKTKEEYFNASKYPKLFIKSTSITKEKDGTYKGIFKLTIKGVTRDITIPFSYIENGDTASFNGTFKINRRDYNVGGSSWTISDDVFIKVTINTLK